MSYDMAQCRITVLKRNCEKELGEAFLTEEDKAGFSPCHLFLDGDSYVCPHPFQMPEDFPCQGAWADIRVEIIAVSAGAELPWIAKRHTALVSCRDVLKPVVFLVERFNV